MPLLTLYTKLFVFLLLELRAMSPLGLSVSLCTILYLLLRLISRHHAELPLMVACKGLWASGDFDAGLRRVSGIVNSSGSSSSLYRHCQLRAP